MRIKKLVTALALSSLLAVSAIGCGKPGKPADASAPVAVTTTSAPVEEETEEMTEARTEAPTETEEETSTEAETQAETQTEAETSQPASAKTMSPGEIWYVGTNVNNQLNVRALPDATSEKVGELYINEEARIEEAPSGDWVRIHSHSCNGYVMTQFLSPSKSDGTQNPEPAPAEQAAPTEPAPASQPAANTATNGHIICIDAGHQQHGISEQEPNGPGSTVMKAKLTTGTQGAATGLTEYQLNLDVSLKLRDELAARGYSVVMIRETNDCPLSNAERAQVANSSGAEVFVRVHANSSDDASVRGAMFYAPSPANPYMSQELIAASNALANTMLNSFCVTTGLQNRGLIQADDMTGINWCTVPVTIAEMGFMSNPDEDRLMADPSFQTTMAQGLANGIDAYFGISR